MRTWLQRLAGGGITSILSTWKVVDLLWGLPGRLDDSEVWQEWIKKVSATDAIYPIGIVGGLLLATSEWWWPRTSRWVRRIRRQDQPRESVVDAKLEQFKQLEPMITRHREALKPIRRLPTFLPFNDIDRRFELTADREELVAELDALKIPHPPYEGERSTWFHYLVQLETLRQTSDLEGARTLYVDGEEEC